MAEAAGLVIGAVGLVSLANTVGDCFDKIETARNLGNDVLQIELELASSKLKYRRWRDTVRITDSAGISTQSTLPVASAEEAIIAKTHLGAIERALKAAEKSTAKYVVEDTPQSASNTNTTAVDVESVAELADSLTVRAERRQRGARFIRKVTWSLHDKKSLQKLADVVSDNVSSLIELFPAERFPALQERQLAIAQQDVQEIAPTGNIEQLQRLAATGMQMDDPWLRAAAESAGEKRQGHSFSNMQTTDKAKALFGDDFAKDAQDPGTRHSFHDIVARGEAMASYVIDLDGRRAFGIDRTVRGGIGVTDEI